MVRVRWVGGAATFLLPCLAGCGGSQAVTSEEPRPTSSPGALTAGAEDDDGEWESGEDDRKDKDLCLPTAGGPHWLKEGETLEVTLSCATGLKRKGGDFKFSSLPHGAHYDKKSGTLRWTPELDQAAVYTLSSWRRRG